MNQWGAILFDTRSIQRYIFSGNKLRTNIGASYIVERVFQDLLVGDILQPGHFGIQSLDEESWKKQHAEGSPKKKKKKKKKKGQQAVPAVQPEAAAAVSASGEADCEVAYIGGGNALILFKDTDQQRLTDIITAFTRKVLVQYPGLKTGAAQGIIDRDEDFGKERAKLYEILKANQNTVFPVVNPPYTGLTLSCEVNGETANYYDTTGLIVPEGEARFFSQEVRAKAEAAQLANKALAAEFADVLTLRSKDGQTSRTYAFPMELGELGQRAGENDIAIVHIDGNQMGQKFSKCKNLPELQGLSYRTQEKTKGAFRKLLKSIVRNCAADRYDCLDLKDHTLPIRPLILGGDDVTFICPARMAVDYAEAFIQEMAEKDKHFGDGIECCAGIAILPAAYPFFRGYELAEQLCGAAKARSRTDDLSWIDFAILHGEQAPTLEQIRADEYTGVLGSMHFGPYQVRTKAAADKQNPFLLSHLKEAAEALRRTLPQNKVKELRSVLACNRHEIDVWSEQLRHNGQALPEIAGWEDFQAALWNSADGTLKTPWVDAIEIMDYLPIMKEEQKGDA
ncbi:hypothetical protein [uncultured Megasphaera sp.]|uniref:Cas10/Cmr2 second palm domain-containing protein n=1 Tax=uncultured Megasphaera sp. TaxID=165188 RepID=UPI00265AB9E7|nr:hypothetical protein [uncultured Megasphaera sp.]